MIWENTIKAVIYKYDTGDEKKHDVNIKSSLEAV